MDTATLADDSTRTKVPYAPSVPPTPPTTSSTDTSPFHSPRVDREFPHAGRDNDTPLSAAPDTRLSHDDQPQSPRSSTSDRASDTPPETDNSHSEEDPGERLRPTGPPPIDSNDGMNYLTTEIRQLIMSVDASPVRLCDHKSLDAFRALPSPGIPEIPDKMFTSLEDFQSYASSLIKEIERRDSHVAELERKVRRLNFEVIDLNDHLTLSLQEGAGLRGRVKGLNSELQNRDRELIQRDNALEDLRSQNHTAVTEAEQLLSELRYANREHVTQRRERDAAYMTLRTVTERLEVRCRGLENAQASDQRELAAAKATIKSLELRFSHLRTSVPDAVDQMCAEEERARQRHPSIPVYFQGDGEDQPRYMGKYSTRRATRASSPASTIGA